MELPFSQALIRPHRKVVLFFAWVFFPGYDKLRVDSERLFRPSLTKFERIVFDTDSFRVAQYSSVQKLCDVTTKKNAAQLAWVP